MTALDHSNNTGPILAKAIPVSGINLTEGSFCPCNDKTGLSDRRQAPRLWKVKEAAQKQH